MTTATMRDARVATWVRVLVAALAVPQLVTGLWAAISPRGWYDTFPGLGPMLVAADPPFNAHLASDAAAGFVATGVVLLLAAAWGERRGIQLALLGLTAFALIHLAYHAANAAPGLTDSQNTVSTISLVFAAAIPIALLLATGRNRKDA